ncbi:MAG TPA: 1-acyl-sn-glycerol-3-phosphate acyltransferase [Proteiniclasticum sp.]|jgi:1-acyl-sn-glycerol-3-phosphate acyltransferase|uniref:lysophospholipid acyltransferase family protein n=1 Tax=Proteiniclasticum sp. TaxID=2053595 RepID=UPI000E80843F|nr:lysophospholipid acyltransferase family protein [Proteiniclasticum sp.]HBW14461.1 1-acyl-sn-glycerol-3-phosphate acyltransferase [Proteiniclasticum sp.]
MLFDIIAKLRFGLSLIRLWFRLIWVKRRKQSLSKDEYYHEIVKRAEIHTGELIKYSKMNLTVDGLENIPDEPVVFMGNHQSYIDIYVTVNALIQKIKSRHLTLIGKKEILNMPIIGRLGTEMDVLYLDRENAREGLKTILEAIRRIKEEQHDVLIYPEGTRSKSRKMNDFHKGSFKIAQKSGAAIVPMVVNDAYKVFEETYRVRPHVPVHLRFLPPIYLRELDPEDEKNIDEILAARIQNELDSWNS